MSISISISISKQQILCPNGLYIVWARFVIEDSRILDSPLSAAHALNVACLVD